MKRDPRHWTCTTTTQGTFWPLLTQKDHALATRASLRCRCYLKTRMPEGTIAGGLVSTSPPLSAATASWTLLGTTLAPVLEKLAHSSASCSLSTPSQHLGPCVAGTTLLRTKTEWVFLGMIRTACADLGDSLGAVIDRGAALVSMSDASKDSVPESKLLSVSKTSESIGSVKLSLHGVRPAAEICRE
eukprot:scaffold259_cov252-Pinguiococcus_pyrenoidosus.AAC.4